MTTKWGHNKLPSAFAHSAIAPNYTSIIRNRTLCAVLWRNHLVCAPSTKKGLNKRQGPGPPRALRASPQMQTPFSSYLLFF